MNRRKIEEDLWEDSEEELSADHVVERFFSQHERDAVHDTGRKGRPGAKPRRRQASQPESEE